jgi:hypothetical protein
VLTALKARSSSCTLDNIHPLVRKEVIMDEKDEIEVALAAEAALDELWAAQNERDVALAKYEAARVKCEAAPAEFWAALDELGAAKAKVNAARAKQEATWAELEAIWPELIANE